MNYGPAERAIQEAPVASCHICNVVFADGEIRVRDHCHLTGETLLFVFFFLNYYYYCYYYRCVQGSRPYRM